MTLSKAALTLGADPRSVQQARRWVSTACEELGRADLTECAELGVSELVTNALLHAVHPISVRLRGTFDHPRVEVADGSHQPPVLVMAPSHEFDDLFSTFGRGLKIVAQCSVAWGAAIEHDGKVVWFEPAQAPQHDSYPEGAIFSLAEVPVQGPPPHAYDPVTVVVAGLPVAPMMELRQHYHDLRREVRLLSLAHEEDYPLATHLTDVFTGFDRAYPREVTHQVDEALRLGRDSFDLEVRIDPGQAETFERMLSLLELADEFCRGERLLSLARSPEQVDFQSWFLGEFIRQAQGMAPLPWSQQSGDGLSNGSASATIVS